MARVLGDHGLSLLSRSQRKRPPMLVDFTMPDLGLGDELVVVSLWLVDVGGTFAAGDRLLELSADGVTVDLPAPMAGALRQVFVHEDDRLTPGMRLAVIQAIAADET